MLIKTDIDDLFNAYLLFQYALERNEKVFEFDIYLNFKNKFEEYDRFRTFMDLISDDCNGKDVDVTFNQNETILQMLVDLNG